MIEMNRKDVLLCQVGTSLMPQGNLEQNGCCWWMGPAALVEHSLEFSKLSHSCHQICQRGHRNRCKIRQHQLE